MQNSLRAQFSSEKVVDENFLVTKIHDLQYITS